MRNLLLILCLAFSVSVSASQVEDCNRIFSTAEQEALFDIASDRAISIIQTRLPAVADGHQSLDNLLADITTEFYISGAFTLFEKRVALELAQSVLEMFVVRFNANRLEANLQKAITESKLEPLQIDFDFSAGFFSPLRRYFAWQKIKNIAHSLDIQILSRNDSKNEMSFRILFPSWKALDKFCFYLLIDYKPAWSSHPRDAKQALKKRLLKALRTHPNYNTSGTIALPERTKDVYTFRIEGIDYL